jgi:hypothetical protein
MKELIMIMKNKKQKIAPHTQKPRKDYIYFLK